MSFVTQLGPHLPFLRRYARALTGSQKSGDSYVKAALTALAENSVQLDQSLSPALSLYQFFHRIWGTTGAQLEKAGDIKADERLQELTPISRQAYLLSALEGFSPSEVATILGETVEDVTALIASAQEEIEGQLRTKVMIIEDEPIIAADIEGLAEELGHDVTGIATTKDEAVELAKQDRPGLILCDIQLADDSSGIDAAHEILEGIDIPLIFITAFPERLLTGEKPEPTYLITKPFQENTVKAAIGQALFFHNAKEAVNTP
jgi:CheY-like chemotaxis protein